MSIPNRKNVTNVSYVAFGIGMVVTGLGLALGGGTTRGDWPLLVVGCLISVFVALWPDAALRILSYGKAKRSDISAFGFAFLRATAAFMAGSCLIYSAGKLLHLALQG